MEWLAIAQQLGLTPLNLVLGGMLYLLMAHLGIAPAPWKEKDEEGEPVPPWAQELQQYFNHNTTSHHEKTHKILEDINEMEKENHSKLEEILKYGVNCRKDQ